MLCIVLYFEKLVFIPFYVYFLDEKWNAQYKIFAPIHYMILNSKNVVNVNFQLI